MRFFHKPTISFSKLMVAGLFPRPYSNSLQCFQTPWIDWGGKA